MLAKKGKPHPLLLHGHTYTLALSINYRLQNWILVQVVYALPATNLYATTNEDDHCTYSQHPRPHNALIPMLHCSSSASGSPSSPQRSPFPQYNIFGGGERRLVGGHILGFMMVTPSDTREGLHPQTNCGIVDCVRILILFSR